jgi:16S rRNA (cytidine1402-2'-O)-methyltransferase
LNIDASLLRQAARAAAGAQHYPLGALYVVATPIGNLADMGLRALHVLDLVDAVACEDTRTTGGLLHRLGLGGKPLLALHRHNENQAAQAVVERLAQGQRVAYASDAGTPAVSDPGARLVAAVVGAGMRVVPVPGPSSALAALCVAADTLTEGFCVEGFLPAKGADRRKRLIAMLDRPQAQVVFEAPHRMATLLAELAAQAPERRLTLCRELTKQFETVHTGRAADMPAWLAGDPQRVRGEFVLVLHAPVPASAEAARPEGSTAGPALPAEAERMLQRLMQELPLKQATTLAADLSGAPRKALYARALVLRRLDGPDAMDDPEPEDRSPA